MLWVPLGLPTAPPLHAPFDLETSCAVLVCAAPVCSSCLPRFGACGCVVMSSRGALCTLCAPSGYSWKSHNGWRMFAAEQAGVCMPVLALFVGVFDF